MEFTKEQVEYLYENLKWLCNPSVDRWINNLKVKSDIFNIKEEKEYQDLIRELNEQNK